MYNPMNLGPHISTLKAILIFALISAGIIASLFDVYYTGEGLSKGLVEANPLNKFLFAKIGQALTAFLEIGLYVIVATSFTAFNPNGSLVIAAIVTVGETIMAFRNRKLVKALTTAKVPAPVVKK